MKKSTHRVDVVKINPEKHPNADTLVIQRVYGYQVVLREEDWKGVELGAYIQPDSVVDTDRPEFSWLKGPNFRTAIEGDKRYHRVCAMRLRGVVSYGLMVPAPVGAVEGDDVSDLLGVTRYQPTILCAHATEAPDCYVKDYDVEAFERYSHEIFKEGESVLCFEKLDGVNSRYVYKDRMHVGSRTIWFKPEMKEQSSWWKILEHCPQLLALCQENPGLIPYGEIIGYVEGHNTKRRYGLKEGIDFYLFDILQGTEYLSWSDVVKLVTKYQIKTVPFVAEMPFNFEKVKALADGPSFLPGAGHNREGIVVRPLVERRELAGRAVLKIVSGKALIG